MVIDPSILFFQSLSQLFSSKKNATTLEHIVDGKAGLAAAREGHFDLIIVDVMLPRLNGFKLCQLLKFDENFLHIPVILLSESQPNTSDTILDDTGANLLIKKPHAPTPTFITELDTHIHHILFDKPKTRL